MYANYRLDLSALPKPGDREDGATDDKHAKTFSNGSDHSFLDFHLSPSYFCFSKRTLPLSSVLWTEALSDNLSVLTSSNTQIRGRSTLATHQIRLSKLSPSRQLLWTVGCRLLYQ